MNLRPRYSNRSKLLHFAAEYAAYADKGRIHAIREISGHRTWTPFSEQYKR